MGDFYELFLEDAIEDAKILEITLTKRGTSNGAGIPMWASRLTLLDLYLSKLIKHGVKVAICAQSKLSLKKDLPKNQNLMKREVVRIITPGT
jgi:Mismatch repair ATPase (MutS family)